MAPEITSLQLPILLPSVLVPFSAPSSPTRLGTELGRLLPQTELPAAQGLFPSSCSKYPRAHAHWMGLGHVPIPQPIPEPTGVRWVGLYPRLPSEAGGLRGPEDLEWEHLPRGDPDALPGGGRRH